MGAAVVTAELESAREEHLVREPRIAAKRLNILKLQEVQKLPLL